MSQTNHKLADAPLLTRLTMSLINVERNKAENSRQDRVHAEAAAMNQRLADLRALLAAQAEQNLRHTRMPTVLSVGRSPGMLSGQDVPLGMDEGMVRLAEAIGRELAYVDLDDMNKEAGIGSTAGNLFKSVGGSIAKGLSAPKVSGTIKNITSGVKATIGGAVQSAQQGVKNVAAKAQQGLSQISGRLQQFGQQSAPSGTPEWMQQKGVLGQSPGKTTGSKPMETSGPAQAPGTQSSTAPFQDTAPNAGAGQGPGQPPPPQQAQPSAPSLQEIADRAGLSNGRWKTKLPMLGAAALGTYGLIQGAKKISDTLSTESKPAQYNQGGATPAFGVNEWGVADRNTPFG